jgi:tRNA dimethylallyltransferase
VQIGLGLEPDQLQPRIVRRTHAMVEAGLVKEVEGLINQYGEDLPLLHTLGYAEIKQYLQGKISLPQATESIIVHTRQFAKRQRTWFRKDPAIHWFDPNQADLLDSVTKLVQVNENKGMF